ncbi:hypothetical protein [Caldithrix abyssi]
MAAARNRLNGLWAARGMWEAAAMKRDFVWELRGRGISRHPRLIGDGGVGMAFRSGRTKVCRVAKQAPDRKRTVRRQKGETV